MSALVSYLTHWGNKIVLCNGNCGYHKGVNDVLALLKNPPQEIIDAWAHAAPHVTLGLPPDKHWSEADMARSEGTAFAEAIARCLAIEVI